MSDAAAADKRAAAEAAVAAEVRNGMVVGLGTGSTAGPAVEAIGRRLATGELRDVRGVPTSSGAADVARRAGVPLTTLDEVPEPDVAIDGADEIAPGLQLVKGLGGALVREKIVAAAARRFVVVADASKQVERLGQRAPIPVEVLAFGLAPTRLQLAALGCDPVLRTDAEGAPFSTDEGNWILDCRFAPIAEPEGLAAAIQALPGVIGHGFFLGLADVAYVAAGGAVSELTG